MANKTLVQLVEKMAADYKTRPLWRDEAFPHHAYQPLTITNPDGRQAQWEAYQIYFQLSMQQIPTQRCRVPLDNLIITPPLLGT